MSFFDENEDSLIEESLHSLDDDIRQSGEGNVGDVCYYDLITNEFGVASTVDSTKNNAALMQDWRYITLGIIINQHEDDKTVDVLMAGFLMAEPLRVPFSYYADDKRPYIRAYAYDMFKRYKKAFFKQCPGYEDLLKLDITFPTVSDMLKVHEHSPEIFNTLRMLTKDTEKFEEYYKRMFDNYIYVRHTNNRIYEMKLTRDKDVTPIVIIPDACVSGDFLCVFRHVDAFNKKKYQPTKDEQDNVFFN